MNEIIDSLVEIKLKSADDFLKIKETLTRIGVASSHKKVLFQSCHILSKQERTKYYITHFKELFALDGKYSTFDETDLAIRNTICNLLEEWGLLTLVDSKKTKSPVVPVSTLKIISAKDKTSWSLEPKYTIGNRGYRK